MATPSTSVGGVEAMEARTDTVSRISQVGRRQRPGGTNRRESSRHVADCELARSHHRFAECLLCQARASTHGGAVLVQSAEPPYADPHVRWCGRGGGATRPPMPIIKTLQGTRKTMSAPKRSGLPLRR